MQRKTIFISAAFLNEKEKQYLSHISWIKSTIFFILSSQMAEIAQFISIHMENQYTINVKADNETNTHTN